MGKKLDYYVSNPNPHNIGYPTYMLRCCLLKRSMKDALDTPYQGRGGDRRSKKFIKKEKCFTIEPTHMNKNSQVYVIDIKNIKNEEQLLTIEGALQTLENYCEMECIKCEISKS